jgi:hypothetical protein
MPPPMMGTWKVEVLGVRPFAIHGDLYYELLVPDPDAPGKVVGLRVPKHVLREEPRTGERYALTFLMGQVTGATREVPTDS